MRPATRAGKRTSGRIEENAWSGVWLTGHAFPQAGTEKTPIDDGPGDRLQAVVGRYCGWGKNRCQKTPPQSLATQGHLDTLTHSDWGRQEEAKAGFESVLASVRSPYSCGTGFDMLGANRYIETFRPWVRS
jgi:hypothetical protein